MKESFFCFLFFKLGSDSFIDDALAVRAKLGVSELVDFQRELVTLLRQLLSRCLVMLRSIFLCHGLTSKTPCA